MSYLENREKKNIDRIKKEIFLKNSSNPYYTNQTIYSINNEYGGSNIKFSHLNVGNTSRLPQNS
jgi:hypothetical protein